MLRPLYLKNINACSDKRAKDIFENRESDEMVVHRSVPEDDGVLTQTEVKQHAHGARAIL
jgi:hypothetical protein